MLEVEKLRFSYPHGRTVLADISFTLPRGEALCLLGPNGTGKTTLLRCLLGLSRPKSGRILWQGQDIGALSMRRRARLMAYVPQHSALNFPYEVREVVMMGRVARLAPGGAPSDEDRQLADNMLDMLGIGGLAHKVFQRLSGGERQLVLIARALAQQAELLVLDEPTASLDFSNQVRILQVIRGLVVQGYTVIMTTHSPDHAFLAATQVLLLNKGLVFAQGAPEAVINEENLSTLYGTPAVIAEAHLGNGRPAVKVCIPLIEQANFGEAVL